MEEIRRAAEQRYEKIGDYREDRAIVELNGKYGFIDLEGNEVVRLKYDYVGGYQEGRARVKLNGKWGVVDLDGNEVVPLKYEWVGGFSQEMASVKLNGKYGYTDLNGNEVLPCWYNSVSRQPYGFMVNVRVSTDDIEHIYFDKDGHLIAEPVNC